MGHRLPQSANAQIEIRTDLAWNVRLIKQAKCGLHMPHRLMKSFIVIRVCWLLHRMLQTIFGSRRSSSAKIPGVYVHSPAHTTLWPAGTAEEVIISRKRYIAFA